MSTMTRNEPTPTRLSNPALFAGWLLYGLLLMLCVGMFALANYGQAVNFAFGDCATFYYEAASGAPTCEQWRAVISNTGLTPAVYESYFLLLRVGAALPFFFLSLLLIRRRGEELRVMLLAGFLLLIGTAGPIFTPFWYWSTGWFSVKDQVPLLLALIDLLDYLLNIGLALFVFLFPDGRFVPKWSTWIAGVWLVIRACDIFFPEALAGIFVMPHQFITVSNTVFAMCALGALIWRYRVYATPVQRQQIKWVSAGALLLTLNYCLDYGVWQVYPLVTTHYLITTSEQGVIWELVQDTLWYASQTVFAICIGLAVFRNRLWDIDAILSRALVYGTLTAAIIALYVLIVGGLGAIFQSQTTAVSGLVATGIIAVLFHPLRDRLQRRIDRMLYGERDDPAAVLTRLAHQLQTADTRTGILPNLAQTIAHALKVPYVAISLPTDQAQPQVVAVWGERREPTQSIPLVYRNETIGELFVAQRSAQERFDQREQKLLHTIAALTAITVRAVQMSDALQESRQRIVTAREEERRRIRRDLHDGFGPALASLPLKIDSAIDLSERDRATSLKLLGQVKQQAQQLVADVRGVVNDLRPPALDELGLVEALRSGLAHLFVNPTRLQLHFDADALPRDLPAALEATAYRITMEAVTNVVKHARADHCQIGLHLLTDPARIEITIEDDGAGLPKDARSNVGLNSMRERAEELGGTFRIAPREGGGTAVIVSLPLPEGTGER